MFVPTNTGIVSSALFSFIILFVIFSYVTKVRIWPGKEKATFLIAITTLLYTCLWLIALSFGEAVFKLELTPHLSQISIFCILVPYAINLLIYLFGGHRPFTWFFPTRKKEFKEGDKT